MVIVKASQEGKKIINEAQCAKARQEPSSWGRESVEKGGLALKIASEHLFRDAVAQKFNLNRDDDNAKVDVEPFINWMEDYKIFYLKNTNYTTVVNDHLKSCNVITIGEIVDQLIKPGLVRTKGATIEHYRAFLQGKIEIEKSVFIAFWKALEIKENWEEFVEEDKNDIISTHLTSFNHKSQVRVISEHLLSQENQVRAFLFSNQCSYSRTWMLRRIEHEITEFLPRVKVEGLNKSLPVTRRVKVEGLNKSLTANLEELNSRFEKHRSTDFSRKTLILTLHIDNYFQDIEIIINDYWKPVLQKAKEQRPNSVFLFLISKRNDWKEKLRENPILLEYIAQLPCPSFTSKELYDEVLLKIALDLQVQYPTRDVDLLKKLAKTLMNEYEENYQQNASIDDPTHTRNLLEGIYKHFNCSPSDFDRQWKNYPPT
jgi:hypothetical protein